jgi:hypothetical protein
MMHFKDTRSILMSYLLWFIVSVALADDNAKYGGLATMNGITFADHAEFPRKWKLVTIRFRKDTGEMRLTYANDSAWATLSKGAINYPDGAVFAKTGIHTGVDDQFPSSIVPKGIRRYQLMVKNRKAYAASGGWGYGLFDAEGKTFPEEPQAAQQACYACHTIVENRGDVFSVPFSFTEDARFPTVPTALGARPRFVWKRPADLPAALKAAVPLSMKRVRWLDHAKLRQHVFPGTLDELRPILEQEARVHNAPAVFVAGDDKRFVGVVPTRTAECGGLGGFTAVSTGTGPEVKTEHYCGHD